MLFYYHAKGFERQRNSLLPPKQDLSIFAWRCQCSSWLIMFTCSVARRYRPLARGAIGNTSLRIWQLFAIKTLARQLAETSRHVDRDLSEGKVMAPTPSGVEMKWVVERISWHWSTKLLLHEFLAQWITRSWRKCRLFGV